MKIRSIELSNFRQFANENKLDFGDGDLRKFSIVYGTNGGGKTTLLSAVFWAFHGEARFINQPNQLATTSVLASSTEPVEVSVSLVFDDAGATFRLVRKQQFTHQAGLQQPVGPSKLLLLDENNQEINPPQREINKRLPLNLSRFFFFPGEHLEGFFAPERLQALEADVKAISLVGLYEEALKYTSLANSRLLSDLRQVTDNQKIKTYTDQIGVIKGQIVEYETKLLPLQADAEALGLQIEEIESESPDTEGTADIASGIELLNQDIAEAYLEIGKATQSIDSLFQSTGYLAFLDRVPEALENLEVNGVAIADQSRHLQQEQFEHLKSEGVCFCGCTIDSERLSELESHVNLEEPLQGAALGAIRDIANVFEGEFSFDDYRNRARLALEAKVLAEQERMNLEQKRLELAAKLGEESVSRITRLAEMQRELREKTSLVTSLTEKLVELGSDLSKVEKKLASEEDKSSGVELIKSQRVLATAIEGALAIKLDGYREVFMNELRTEVSAILKSLIVQDVEVEVLEDLTILVFEPGTRAPFGLAGGQEKAKPIAMAIALQRIARRRASQARLHNLSLTDEYPLMIDSAFGELGTDLRRKVVAELLKESGQTILLVSDTQAPGVADSIPVEFIDKEFLLHSWSSQPGVEVREPAINGKTVAWQSYGAPTNKTTIEVL